MAAVGARAIQLTGEEFSAFPAGPGILDRWNGSEECIVHPAGSILDKAGAVEFAPQSDEHLRGILDAEDLAIISADILGQVAAISIGCEAFFDLPRTRILGANLSALFSDVQLGFDVAEFISDPQAPVMQRCRVSRTHRGGECYRDIVLQRVFKSGNQPAGFLCIVRDVTEAVRIHRKLEALSVLDELTGLYNQRCFIAKMADEIERSRRFNLIFSLCFMDLDGLKRYNDSRGHVQGDQALMECGRLISCPVRMGVDTCFRYGGDEFTVMMPETNRFQARIVCDRILKGLSLHFNGEITASAGVAEFSPMTSGPELIEKADRAMYRAKALGVNRIVLAG